MKVSQKNLEYILLFFIVVIAFGAYRFGYMNYTEKAEQIEKQNKSIEARIEMLKKLESERGIFNEAIANADTRIADVIQNYSTGNTPEKSILIMRELEKKAGCEIANLSFYSEDPIFMSTDVREDGTPKLVGYATQVAITYSTSYDGFKKMMDFINGYPERMNVQNFTTSYNQETGGLSGTMTIRMYSIDDGEYTYIAPEVTGIKLGTDNIFSSVELKPEKEAPVVEPAADAEEPFNEGENAEGEPVEGEAQTTEGN